MGSRVQEVSHGDEPSAISIWTFDGQFCDSVILSTSPSTPIATSPRPSTDSTVVSILPPSCFACCTPLPSPCRSQPRSFGWLRNFANQGLSRRATALSLPKGSNRRVSIPDRHRQTSTIDPNDFGHVVGIVVCSSHRRPKRGACIRHVVIRRALPRVARENARNYLGPESRREQLSALRRTDPLPFFSDSRAPPVDVNLSWRGYLTTSRSHPANPGYRRGQNANFTGIAMSISGFRAPPPVTGLTT